MKCVWCYNNRSACVSGVAPYTPVLRSKRSADAALVAEPAADAGPSKIAKPTHASSASAVRSALPPVPPLPPLEIPAVTRTQSGSNPRTTSSFASVDAPRSFRPMSRDRAEDILLAVQGIRRSVTSIAADLTARLTNFVDSTGEALDDLEDKVREACRD